MAIVSLAALILIFTAVFAEALVPNDPYKTSASLIRTAPCREFLFGTDNLGRCVFSRVLVGAKTTISATFFLVAVSFVIGTLVGMLCGYFGGALD